MTNSIKIFKSFLRIAGLTTFIVIVSVAILYIKFGPGPEPGPIFPVDPKGEFVQQPFVITTLGVQVRWIVATKCQYNEMEFQEVDQLGQDGWFGGTPDCSMTEEGFTCTAPLDNRGLVEDQKYNLQVHSAQCGAGSSYISEVVQFMFHAEKADSTISSEAQTEIID